MLESVYESALVLELQEHGLQVNRQVHRKQIQSYLKLTGYRLGYLLNFGAPVMRDGIVRCVNGLGEA